MSNENGLFPPGHGTFIIPPIQKSVGVWSAGATKVFLNPDEAYITDRNLAELMLHDPDLYDPLSVRVGATTLLPWHVEPEQKGSKEQKKIAHAIQHSLEQIEHFDQMRSFLAFGGIWYGNGTVQLRYEYKFYKGMKVLTVTGFDPVHADNVQWRWDEPGKVGILVFPGSLGKGTENLDWVPGPLGPMKLISDEERDRLIIHRHAIWAGSYFEPRKAGLCMGVGLRNFLWWQWKQKCEYSASQSEYAERFGHGQTKIMYAANHSEMKEQAEIIAQSYDPELVYPLPMDRETGKPLIDIVRTPPDSAGLENYSKVIETNRQIFRRAITGTEQPDGALTVIGEDSSSENAFSRTVRGDARKLQDTLSHQLITVIQRWSFPETVGKFKCKFVINVDRPNPEKFLQAVSLFANLFGKEQVDVDQVRNELRLSKPPNAPPIMPTPQPGQPGPGQPPLNPFSGQDGANPQLPQAGRGDQPIPQPGPQGPPEAPPPDHAGNLDRDPDISPEDDEALERAWEGLGRAQRSTYAIHRAPRGYTRQNPLVIQGKGYIGGQVIPNAVVNSATDEEKAKLGGQQHGPERPPGFRKPGLSGDERKARNEAARQEQRQQPPTTGMSYTEREELKNKISDLLPGYDPAKLHELIGAPGGSKVWVSKPLGAHREDGINISVFDHPDISNLDRTLHTDKDGQLVMHNNLFFMKKRFGKGSGLGNKVFVNEVRECVKAGVNKIETTAGKGAGMIGYYVWARFGYDAELGGYFKYHLQTSKRVSNELKGSQPKTVQDLMKTPEGREYWKKNGYQTNMTFDLSQGSRSLQVLNAYLKEKGQPEIEFAHEAGKQKQGERKEKAKIGAIDRVHNQFKDLAQQNSLKPEEVKQKAEQLFKQHMDYRKAHPEVQYGSEDPADILHHVYREVINKIKGADDEALDVFPPDDDVADVFPEEEKQKVRSTFAKEDWEKLEDGPKGGKRWRNKKSGKITYKDPTTGPGRQAAKPKDEAKPKKEAAQSNQDVKEATHAVTTSDRDALSRVRDKIKAAKGKRGGLGVKGLQEIARVVGLKGHTRLTKDRLIDALVDKLGVHEKHLPERDFDERVSRIKQWESDNPKKDKFLDLIVNQMMAQRDLPEDYREALGDVMANGETAKDANKSTVKAKRKEFIDELKNMDIDKPTKELLNALSSIRESKDLSLTPQEAMDLAHEGGKIDRINKPDKPEEGIIPDDLQLAPAPRTRKEAPERKGPDYYDRIREPLEDRQKEIADMEKKSKTPFMGRVIDRIIGSNILSGEGKQAYEKIAKKIEDAGRQHGESDDHFERRVLTDRERYFYHDFEAGQRFMKLQNARIDGAHLTGPQENTLHDYRAAILTRLQHEDGLTFGPKDIGDILESLSDDGLGTLKYNELMKRAKSTNIHRNKGTYSKRKDQ